MLEYNKHKTIPFNKALVEYEKVDELEFTNEGAFRKEVIKINQDNTINIKPITIESTDRIKNVYNMVIDGFDYHFIDTKYNTKEELEEKLKWFSNWMKNIEV